jgi:SAM-dependent methyltransferase
MKETASMDLELTGERTLPGVASENYWFRRHVAAYRYATALVGGRVVDAGCGEGYGAAILSRRAKQIIALDLDAPTLIHAKRRYLIASFVRGDLERIPVADASADAIVALQVLEHLSEAESFLRSCARTLRPGGLLVLSTPNAATFPSGINPFHVREYAEAELSELLGGFFPDVRLRGLAHGAPLRTVERLLGEPIQDRMVRQPYEELPRSLRAVLRLVTAGSFRLTLEPSRALDLFAICRNARFGAQPLTRPTAGAKPSTRHTALSR